MIDREFERRLSERMAHKAALIEQALHAARRGDRALLARINRELRRRPGPGGMPALVEPPRGPLPLQGGAAAPLEFDS